MNPPVFRRRGFIKSTAAAASALAFPLVASRNVLGANERLNVAGIGVGGKGAVDVDGCAGENIVALCDVDEANARATFSKYSTAKRYKDFRVLLEKEKSIDAVTISTPDHMHALPAAMAIKMKKHVYLQKPLTHTVYEARRLTELAKFYKVATQMGNQGHSNAGTRRMVELIRSGVLGRIQEIHCWTDRPIWPQAIDRPSGSHRIPSTLDWDLWLGVAPERPFNPAYAPFKWRGFWDFGTGALGDMGCHVMDLPFFALDLKNLVRVKAFAPKGNPESAPAWSVITYHFEQSATHPDLKLVWYDGGQKPSPEAARGLKLSSNGVLIHGSEDTLYVDSYWGSGRFLSGRPLSEFKSVSEYLPKSEDFDRNHYREWIAACKGGAAALSNFDYAGPLTEAVLLGNVALRTGEAIDWSSRGMKITNVDEASRLLHKKYRKGWGEI
ncbi:MAG: Gfo/Idh/MocA family oxidoreductase [Verrucomicrobia bacterium]|nr:Gfo/Idh/MocA family oxidoreductase [Verrucomicrobiota bacterium]